MMKTTSPTSLLAFALLAAAASLAVAFASQYGFGLKPCELCILQRIPYGVVIALSIVGLTRKNWAKGLVLIIAVCFLADSGIATYHAAVEQHWIPGPEACTDAGAGGKLTVEQILAKIKGAPIVACDQPQWDFHGVTMAALNAVWALLLAIVMFGALRKDKYHA